MDKVFIFNYETNERIYLSEENCKYLLDSAILVSDYKSLKEEIDNLINKRDEPSADR